MKLYIAWIKCVICKLARIEDAESITIYFAPDCIEQYCEIVCPDCGSLATENIDDETTTFFVGIGANIKSFGDQFEPLTEKMIDEWNINEFIERI